MGRASSQAVATQTRDSFGAVFGTRRGVTVPTAEIIKSLLGGDPVPICRSLRDLTRTAIHDAQRTAINADAERELLDPLGSWLAARQRARWGDGQLGQVLVALCAPSSDAYQDAVWCQVAQQASGALRSYASELFAQPSDTAALHDWMDTHMLPLALADELAAQFRTPLRRRKTLGDRNYEALLDWLETDPEIDGEIVLAEMDAYQWHAAIGCIGYALEQRGTPLRPGLEQDAIRDALADSVQMVLSDEL